MLKKVLRNSLSIFILASGVFYGCGDRQKTTVSEPIVEEQIPDQEGWNSTIISTNEGRVDAIINYAYMQRFSKKQIVDFDSGVKVDFFDSKGNHTSTLTAKGGRFYETNNSVEAFGNVVVISDSGVTLYSERIQWDPKKQQVLSNEFVTITTAKGDTLRGKGFVSDPQLEKFEIYQPRGVSAQKVNMDIEARAQKSAENRSVAVNRNRADTDSLKSQPDRK